MYAYVNGDPVNLGDPLGLSPASHEDFCAVAPGKCDGTDSISDTDLMYENMTAMAAGYYAGINAQRNGPDNGYSRRSGDGFEFADDSTVQDAFDDAWRDSNPDAPNVMRGSPGSKKREQGGWVIENSDGSYGVIRGMAGTRDSRNAYKWPYSCPWCKVVGVFHTHPNKLEEDYSPRYVDAYDQGYVNAVGVPGVIITWGGYVYIRPQR